jgi:hypothetical protein
MVLEQKAERRRMRLITKKYCGFGYEVDQVYVM